MPACLRLSETFGDRALKSGATAMSDTARVRADTARWGYPILVGVALLTFAWLAVYVPTALSGWTGPHLGWDLHNYLVGARRWLETGSPYDVRFLTHPYRFEDWVFIHPPIALILFAPFLILPTIAWWILPIGVVSWCFWTWRPGPITWAFMLPIWAMPLSVEVLFMGNSSLWATAFVAAGLRFGWPLALLIVKPTLLPLAVVRARDRRVWIGLLVLSLACLPFGALWLDWVALVRNFDGPPIYTLYNLPLIASPIVAWLGRSRVQHVHAMAAGLHD